MNTTWLERPDGYFFPRDNLSSAIESKLQMLALEDAAQVSEEGTLIPFEQSFALTEEDAELLSLPPRNPYQLSIRTEGYIGRSFRYVVEFLDAQGRPVVEPQIRGALLRVDETLFRLNADQFALINLVKLGNDALTREEPLLIVKRLQTLATVADARTDKYIADKKIIVPDKLDVAFQDSGDSVKVAPVLLERRDGELAPIDSADFQTTFGKRNRVSSVYRGKDGAQYVFNATLRDGLEQIKSVGTLSKAEAARYKLQPRELFTGEAFDFSDRVKGVEAVSIGTAYKIPGGIKIDWTNGEHFTTTPTPKPTNPIERPATHILGIKENLTRNEYVTGLKTERRLEKFYVDVLREGMKLYDYQRFGVWWMLQLWQDGWRGILVADDMGLGKTLQTLAFIAGLKKFGGVNQPILIVAPTALLTNWKVEYEKFLRENIFSEVISLHGAELRKFFTKDRTPNGKRKLSLRTMRLDSIALTTYETLRDYQFSFAEISWACIIADEAQKIKNPGAFVTKALKAMKYDFAICLSGTPVENSWQDLWSIMDFVQPAHLDDLETFKARYADGLTADNIQRLGTELKEKLEPLLLRRMKEDYLPALPAKHVVLCPQEMPPYQSRVYSAVLEKYRRGEFKTSFEFLGKLRDVSLHPDLATLPLEKFFTLDAVSVIKRSARLIKTFDILRQIKSRGEKVLLFVTNRKAQAILKHLLQKIFALEVLPPINGSMLGSKRQETIKAFANSRGFNVLILSPEAAGVGFTITEANNVIHLGRTWNPAKESQATDRVYRIGQSRAVNVYLPLAVNTNLRGKTFDENLDALLNYKKVLSVKVLFPTAETDADAKTLAELLKPSPDERLDAACWTIEAVDEVTGLAFEQIISDLFNGMEDFTATKTPDTNDFGADVVVQAVADDTGLLIQCKHADNPSKAIGKAGVQQICAAVAYYNDKHKRTFQPVVVTNAGCFTPGAIELAGRNAVRLIARNELSKLLSDCKVLRC